MLAVLIAQLPAWGVFIQVRGLDDDGDGRHGDPQSAGWFVMTGIKRAVVSGVLVAGMGLPMIAAVPAAAQSGYGAPYPGQYASQYYGGGYRDNGAYGNGYRNDGYGNNGGYRGGNFGSGYYDGGYRNNTAYYNNRGNGIGPGKGAAIGGLAGVVLGGLLGGGKGALIGGAAGAGIGAAAGAANQNSRRYDSYGYRRY